MEWHGSARDPEGQSEGVADPTAPQPAQAAGSGGSKLARIGIGIPVIFIVMSVLYGPTTTTQALFFGVICTAGLGLIPMLFLSWAVGWVVLAVWHSFGQGRTAPKVS